MISVGCERGLANCPAMRPTFTTGWPPANVMTTDIWRNTRKKSRMLSAECSAKLSAQSPPWSRKAGQALFHDRKFLGIGIVRHLHKGEFPPAIRCPIGQHSRNSRYKGMGLYTQFPQYSSTAGSAID